MRIEKLLEKLASKFENSFSIEVEFARGFAHNKTKIEWTLYISDLPEHHRIQNFQNFPALEQCVENLLNDEPEPIEITEAIIEGR